MAVSPHRPIPDFQAVGGAIREGIALCGSAHLPSKKPMSVEFRDLSSRPRGINRAQNLLVPRPG